IEGVFRKRKTGRCAELNLDLPSLDRASIRLSRDRDALLGVVDPIYFAVRRHCAERFDRLAAAATDIEYRERRFDLNLAQTPIRDSGMTDVHAVEHGPAGVTRRTAALLSAVPSGEEAAGNGSDNSAENDQQQIHFLFQCDARIYEMSKIVKTPLGFILQS